MALFCDTRVELSAALLDGIPETLDHEEKSKQFEGALRSVCPSVTVSLIRPGNDPDTGDGDQKLQISGQWDDIVKAKELLSHWTPMSYDASGTTSNTLLEYIMTKGTSKDHNVILKREPVHDHNAPLSNDSPDETISMLETTPDNVRMQPKKKQTAAVKKTPRRNLDIPTEESPAPEKSHRPRRNVKHSILPFLKSKGHNFVTIETDDEDENPKAQSLGATDETPKLKREIRRPIKQEKSDNQPESSETPKRKRGRPRKQEKPIDQEKPAKDSIKTPTLPKRGRGRPIKQEKDVEEPAPSTLPNTRKSKRKEPSGSIDGEERIAKTAKMDNEDPKETDTVSEPENEPGSEECEAPSPENQQFDEIVEADDKTTIRDLVDPKINEFITTSGGKDNCVYKCTECSYNTTNNNYLKCHIKRTHMPKDYQCHICCKQYGLHKDLLGHMGSHTQPHVCEICPKGFARPYLLEAHMRKRHSENPKKRGPKPKGDGGGGKKFACSMCPYVTHKSRHYTLHLQRSHNEKVFKCNFPDCEEKFCWLKDLNKHEEGHGGLYECNICQKVLKNKHCLQLHVNNIHLGIKPPRPKSYQCERCGHVSRSKTDHTRHMNKVHLNVRPFQCDKCPMAFFGKVNLKVHQYIHEDIFRFICQVCGRKFKQRQGLRGHMVIHREVDDLPFQCQTCNRRFTQPGALRRHIRTHSGLRPYACKMCKANFNDYSILRRHLIGIHKMGDLDEVRQAIQEACLAAKEVLANAGDKKGEPQVKPELVKKDKIRGSMPRGKQSKPKPVSRFPSGTTIVIKPEESLDGTQNNMEQQQIKVIFQSAGSGVEIDRAELSNLVSQITAHHQQQQQQQQQQQIQSVQVGDQSDAVIIGDSDGQMTTSLVSEVHTYNATEPQEDYQEVPVSQPTLLTAEGEVIKTSPDDHQMLEVIHPPDQHPDPTTATPASYADQQASTDPDVIPTYATIIQDGGGDNQLQPLTLLPDGQHAILQHIDTADLAGDDNTEQIIVITSEQQPDIGSIISLSHQPATTGVIETAYQVATETTVEDDSAETLSYNEAASVLGMLIPQIQHNQQH